MIIPAIIKTNPITLFKVKGSWKKTHDKIKTKRKALLIKGYA